MHSNGFTNTGRIMGSSKTANWMDLSGTVDEASMAKAGVTIFEHPASFRHPTPWYIYFDGKFGAIKSAPVYAEPITIKAGKSFTLRYRVLIHPGNATKSSRSHKAGRPTAKSLVKLCHHWPRCAV
jgi:hypothetical protein